MIRNLRKRNGIRKANTAKEAAACAVASFVPSPPAPATPPVNPRHRSAAR